MTTPSQILALADRCVKCGLCLPQCPTYQQTSNENESPRGRIALVQGWLDGHLKPSSQLTTHLDQCLLCRRCERVCPSLVPYGEIMDQARHLYATETKQLFTAKNLIEKWSLDTLIYKVTAAPLLTALRLLQKIGLLKLAQTTGIARILKVQRLLAYLPPLQKTLHPDSFYPATSQTQNNQTESIGLFTGCLSNKLDQHSVKDSISLLNQLGFNVYVPKQQQCCGSMAQHEGNQDQARELAKNNVEIFNQLKIRHIVSLVNGCSVQLKEYEKAGFSFNHEVKDIIEFLAEYDWQDHRLNSCNEKIALHIPCTLQNSLRADDKLLALMRKIPGIELPPEAIYSTCCGAAGSYFLRNPTISDALGDNAAESILKTAPQTVISSNIGCTLQLNTVFKEKNVKIKVIHPVTLLLRHLSS